MYLTVLRPPKKEVSFEELLKNPFMTYPIETSMTYKKVTVEVPEAYAQSLYNRTIADNIEYPIPTQMLPYNEIKNKHLF